MEIALITGSSGLVGSAVVKYFSSQGLKTVGIDNDMRSYFFGKEASTKWKADQLKREIDDYEHLNIDIRDLLKLEEVFKKYTSDIKVIIHAAAQPSHDWATQEPLTDFNVNANGTQNLLETTRQYCPDATFIFTSTNKVYGDTPNHLPLVELESRWEIDSSHPYYERGIDESMSLDATKHSLFGVSKVAADVMVQEYGRYFGMKTACYRCGCLTGPGHSGAKLHGFLSFLMKSAVLDNHYTIYGYKGKQVRDNIHCDDLARSFYYFYKNPRVAEIYNMGGSRHSNCSVLEAIKHCENITGKKMSYSYEDENRIGDHIWWISDVSKFQEHYPEWTYTYDIEQILQEIYLGLVERLK